MKPGSDDWLRDIIDRVKHGDRAARWEFLLYYEPLVRAWCLRERANPTCADDVSGAVLDDFLDNRVQEVANPLATTWYLRLAARREAWRWPHLMPRRYAAVLDGAAPPETADPIFPRLRAWLEDCLGHLSDPVRRTVLARVAPDEPTFEDLGQRFGDTKEANAKRFRVGLDKLRKCLTQKALVLRAERGPEPGAGANPLPGFGPDFAFDAALIERLLAARVAGLRAALADAAAESAELRSVEAVLAGAPASCAPARVWLGETDERAFAAADAAFAAHRPSCPRCQALWQLLTAARGPAEGQPGIRASAARSLGKPPRALRTPVAPQRGRWFWSGAAAAALVLAAGVSLLLTHGPSGSPTAEPCTPGGLCEKAGSGCFDAQDQLQVAVQRGADVFRLRAGDALQRGDRLSFFYTASRAGYLALFDIDTSGVALLHPQGADFSVPVAAGAELPLDAGAAVKAGDPQEWLVAVFTDFPAPVEALRDGLARLKLDGALAGGSSGRAECAPGAAIPGARTLRIFPFRR